MFYKPLTMVVNGVKPNDKTIGDHQYRINSYNYCTNVSIINMEMETVYHSMLLDS